MNEVVMPTTTLVQISMFPMSLLYFGLSLSRTFRKLPKNMKGAWLSITIERIGRDIPKNIYYPSVTHTIMYKNELVEYRRINQRVHICPDLAHL